jgi:hypothetical protein
MREEMEIVKNFMGSRPVGGAAVVGAAWAMSNPSRERVDHRRLYGRGQNRYS